MTRTSPGVKRIAAILDFLADHPTQSFALTDLVRALKLSRATCHALLTGLVDVGYLFRTSDKTYVLGPALATIATEIRPILVKILTGDVSVEDGMAQMQAAAEKAVG